MTQLGLIPVCADESYYFFPSRSIDGDDHSLGALVRTWLARCFGVDDARAFVAPARPVPSPRDATVTLSFGVGGNERKRVSASFETGIVQRLVERGWIVHLDGGATPAERTQARDIAAAIATDRIHLHEGGVGALAALIGSSRLYVGYDSAGQHIAAAMGVPSVSVFRGYASPRIPLRWRPTGAASSRVVDADCGSDAVVLAAVLMAVDALGLQPRPCAAATA